MNDLAFWWFSASKWSRFITIFCTFLTPSTLMYLVVIRPRNYEWACSQSSAKISALNAEISSERGNEQALCEVYREYVDLLSDLEGKLAVCVPSSKGDGNRANLSAQLSFYKRLKLEKCGRQ